MDDSLLSGVDLSQYSEQQQEKMLAKLYGKLEEQVGEKVAALVSDQQFDQFEALIDQGDEDKLDEWLMANVPDYEKLVEDTLNQLKQELQTNPQAFE